MADHAVMNGRRRFENAPAASADAIGCVDRVCTVSEDNAVVALGVPLGLIVAGLVLGALLLRQRHLGKGGFAVALVAPTGVVLLLPLFVILLPGFG